MAAERSVLVRRPLYNRGRATDRAELANTCGQFWPPSLGTIWVPPFPRASSAPRRHGSANSAPNRARRRPDGHSYHAQVPLLKGQLPTPWQDHQHTAYLHSQALYGIYYHHHGLEPTPKCVGGTEVGRWRPVGLPTASASACPGAGRVAREGYPLAKPWATTPYDTVIAQGNRVGTTATLGEDRGRKEEQLWVRIGEGKRSQSMCGIGRSTPGSLQGGIAPAQRRAACHQQNGRPPLFPPTPPKVACSSAGVQLGWGLQIEERCCLRHFLSSLVTHQAGKAAGLHPHCMPSSHELRAATQHTPSATLLHYHTCISGCCRCCRCCRRLPCEK